MYYKLSGQLLLYIVLKDGRTITNTYRVSNQNGAHSTTYDFGYKSSEVTRVYSSENGISQGSVCCDTFNVVPLNSSQTAFDKSLGYELDVSVEEKDKQILVNIGDFEICGRL